MKGGRLGSRLTLWSALIVAVALVASALASDIFIYRTERRGLDAELHQQAEHFFEQYRLHGSQVEWITTGPMEEIFSPRAANRFVLIQTGDGQSLYRSPNLPLDTSLPVGEGKMHHAKIGEAAVRLGVFHRHGLTLYLAGDTADFTALVVRLMVGHLVALPFVLAAVAFGGWWLAKEALRPVKTMADATDSIRPEDLATRLPESSEDDEIGRLTRAFNRMLERLERGFQQATRFSSDASHELRTPLAVLRGSVEELLSDADLTEPQRVAVEELEDQVQHLISITSTLLLLARADAGRLKLQVEDTDLRSIVTDCLEDARILGEQREVVIECALSEPAPLQADEVRLGQAVLNLLDNAVKYNAPGGRVEVKLAALEDGWSLRVGNSGPEIPAEARAGLFERFFRAGQHEDTPGAGLGLSLARELVRTHGGDIALIQSSNGWNEFEMTLPKKAK